MALGLSVKMSTGRHTGALQTIYSLEKWPHAEKAIIGGGAVLTRDLLAKIMNRYENKSKSLAIVGVDVSLPNLSDNEVDFLNKIAFFSVRSNKQCRLLKEYYNLQNVRVHPDIAFTLINLNIKRTRSNPKIFGLNVCPRFLNEYNKAPCAHTKEKLFSYCRYVQFAARYFSNQGYKLVHFPFTPYDNISAKQILKGFDVKFLPYTDNPVPVIEEMNKSEVFFASRYHSLIFCLIFQIPVVPFLYAQKSYNLFDDFIDGSVPLGINDLGGAQKSDEDLKAWVLNQVILPMDKITPLSLGASEMLNEAVDKIS